MFSNCKKPYKKRGYGFLTVYHIEKNYRWKTKYLRNSWTEIFASNYSKAHFTLRFWNSEVQTFLKFWIRIFRYRFLFNTKMEMNFIKCLKISNSDTRASSHYIIYLILFHSLTATILFEYLIPNLFLSFFLGLYKIIGP